MKKIFILFLLLQFGLKGQNWNPFNYAYRYNYALNNSAFVTNVLFADSFELSGQDTMLYLNRIATPCIGKCLTTTVTVPQGKYYVVRNIPQAMQRVVAKKNSGWLRFLDTANINISPTLALNQTWVCDTAAGINAQLTALSTRNIFGSIDSVRIYMLGSADTLVLSKNHGIIVFPIPYSKNKFYRLKGIERNNFYDSVSVAGYKVPNAWDIYNYQVGDVFCYEQNGYDKMKTIPEYFDAKEQLTITSKTISALGYTFGFNKYIEASKYLNLFYPPQQYLSAYSSGTLFFATTGTLNSIENTMYPGAVIKGIVPVQGREFVPGGIIRNVGNFGLATNNTFCKFFGSSNLNGMPSSADNSCIVDVAGTNGKIMERTTFRSSGHFLQSFGHVSSSFQIEEGFVYTKLVCFERNGVSIFGPQIIGLSESAASDRAQLFPNPASDRVFCKEAGNALANITDLLGKKIVQKQFDTAGFCDVSDIAAGTYIITVQSEQGPILRSKLLITR